MPSRKWGSRRLSRHGAIGGKLAHRRRRRAPAPRKGHAHARASSGPAVLDDVEEVVRVLAENGADIDRIQPGGVSAVVELLSTRQWESALYLIEKGANLDIENERGLSVDYYLDSWKDNAYGEHPEGRDRVREAIARRRAARK